MLRGQEKQWLYQILTLKLVRIIQTPFVLYTLFTYMFAHAAINHCTYCLIFLAKYKEMRGEGWLKTFVQYCIATITVSKDYITVNISITAKP